MGDGRFHAPDEFRSNAWVKSMEAYKDLYQQSIDDPEIFWAGIANAKTNITYNCLDRHLETRGDQTALIWDGNNIGEDLEITCRHLHESSFEELCRCCPEAVPRERPHRGLLFCGETYGLRNRNEDRYHSTNCWPT